MMEDDSELDQLLATSASENSEEEEEVDMLESEDDAEEVDQLASDDADDVDQLASDEDISEESNQNAPIPATFKPGRTVPYETVQIPLGDKTQIEKLLSYQEDTRKILVKYKHMSYYHCEWVDESVILAHKSGKQRIKRFMEKGIYDQWSDDDPFNPSFLNIDRIIDEGELEKDQVFFLVKWPLKL